MFASIPGARALVGLLIVAGVATGAPMIMVSPAAAGPGVLVPARAPAAGVAAPRCPAEPAAAPVIAEPPWPQQRYDLITLGQISDGAGVSVAVVDSGVRAEHPQLHGAVRAGYDLLDRSGDGRLDCVGHGTAVASIIAARPVTGVGLRGLAPAARILPVRVTERTVSSGDDAGDVAGLAAGIRAATASHPKPAVINLSLATRRDDPALRVAVRQALEADIVVVAAVGNWYEEGSPAPFPASYDGVVGVGAIGLDGQRMPSSSAGPYVDLVGPGDGVVGAAGRRGHATFQGTSFAAPFVAGTAALIRARWPDLSRVEVVRRLLATADPAPGGRFEYGSGVVNPLRALTEVVWAPASPAAARPTDAAPAPAAPGAASRQDGSRTGPASSVLSAAATLVVLAAVIALGAVTVPQGRRRRWRPDPPQAAPHPSGHGKAH